MHNILNRIALYNRLRMKSFPISLMSSHGLDASVEYTMKVCSVALGFTQEYGFNYENNADPITKMTTDCSCICLSVRLLVFHRWMLKVLFTRGTYQMKFSLFL